MRKSIDRKRKTKDPCVGCGLHKRFCICHLIPTLILKTRICLVIHRKELSRTTNTGQLAIKSLTNSELRIRGGLNKEVLNLSDLLIPEYRTVLFFPSDEAIELNDQFINESPLPIQLIVPDGNWRQASKVFSRQKELKDIVKVKISRPQIESHHLRTEHTADGMSTLEAIALALSIIEGHSVIAPLRKLYQAKLENTLLGRGFKF